MKLSRLFLAVALLAVAGLAATSSAQFSDLLLVSTPTTAVISSINLSGGTTFSIPATSGSTIDTISATCSVGSCAGATFALATQTGCTSTNNSAFAVSTPSLNIGGTTINDTTARTICLRASLTGALSYYQSFTLTGSSTVACDEGPNAPGLSNYPADVTTSGLTYCALNADFTSSTTDGNGIKYSDISTWVIECGASSHTYDFHISWWFNRTSPSPCPTALGGENSISIISDPLGGGFNVLHQTYTLTDQTRFYSTCGSQCNNNNFAYDSLNLNWPAMAQNSPGLPYEMYKETTVYMPATALNAGAGTTAGISPQNNETPRLSPSSTDISAAGTSGHFIASDQYEINPTGGYDTGQTSWVANIGWGVETTPGTIPFSGNENLPTFNFASGYNVIGQLITSDESNRVSQCIFINGALQGSCLVLNMTSAGVTTCSGRGYSCYFNKNTKVLMNFVPIAMTCFPYNFPGNGSFGGDGNVGTCLHNAVDVYYKSLRVFTCSGYKTTQCPGPVITASNAVNARRYANDNTPEGLIREAVSWILGKAA